MLKQMKMISAFKKKALIDYGRKMISAFKKKHLLIMGEKKTRLQIF